MIHHRFVTLVTSCMSSLLHGLHAMPESHLPTLRVTWFLVRTASPPAPSKRALPSKHVTQNYRETTGETKLLMFVIYTELSSNNPRYWHIHLQWFEGSMHVQTHIIYSFLFTPYMGSRGAASSQ